MNKKPSVADQYVMALSSALEQRRRQVGISQDELAEKAGLHRTLCQLDRTQILQLFHQDFPAACSGIRYKSGSTHA